MDIIIFFSAIINLIIIYNLFLIAPLYIQIPITIGGIWIIQITIETFRN